MRLWFSRDELCTLAQQRMHDGQAALRSNHDWEYDRALADALPSQAPERHTLRWSLLKQLQENRSQLVELFALQALVTAAQGGDQRAFFRLKEQVWECHELGLGERLADGMAESEAAGFLAPFIQALYTLADAKGKLRDLPLESQQMADEIVRLARLRQEKR